VVRSMAPSGAALYTDEWAGDAAVGRAWCGQHGTVKHSRDEATGTREWARDDDDDGRREVHCNGCEGLGTALRTFLRRFRGVHKKNLWDYVAVFEAATNAKRITPALARAMCGLCPDAQLNYS